MPPGSSISIRPFRIGDYEEVYSIWRKAEGVGLNESDNREAVGRYLRRNPGLSQVAVSAGRVIAAVLCGTTAGGATCTTLPSRVSGGAWAWEGPWLRHASKGCARWGFPSATCSCSRATGPAGSSGGAWDGASGPTSALCSAGRLRLRGPVAGAARRLPDRQGQGRELLARGRCGAGLPRGSGGICKLGRSPMTIGRHEEAYFHAVAFLSLAALASAALPQIVEITQAELDAAIAAKSATILDVNGSESYASRAISRAPSTSSGPPSGHRQAAARRQGRADRGLLRRRALHRLQAGRVRRPRPRIHEREALRPRHQGLEGLRRADREERQLTPRFPTDLGWRRWPGSTVAGASPASRSSRRRTGSRSRRAPAAGIPERAGWRPA
jgi:hypothetical protein